MRREQKVKIVDELKEAMSRCSLGILTDYQGLSASESTVLRKKLRQMGIEYRVVKNTLARFAAEKADKDFLSGNFEGPVAIAFGYGDVIEPARALLDYINSSEKAMSIKGGFLGDRLLTAEEVKTLARIPSREVLLAQLISGMQSPIVALLNCLNSPLRGTVAVLQNRIKQLEGG
jgi:large subunit ribosomal protein L10